MQPVLAFKVYLLLRKLITALEEMETLLKTIIKAYSSDQVWRGERSALG